MPIIEKFLGQRVNIPEELRYHTKPGLWAKIEGQEIVFGLTEPFLVLSGGLKELEWLSGNGQTVEADKAVVFAITSKIKYIDTPIAGVISFNYEVKLNPTTVGRDPYGKGWLFTITPNSDAEQVFNTFYDADHYLESIKGSDGFKNPEGLKGGVSGMCKAVYSGIHQQKI